MAQVRSTADRVLENRIRRMAERQGLRLAKSKRRDPHALDFGQLTLVNREGEVVFDGGTSFEAVEQYLTRSL